MLKFCTCIAIYYTCDRYIYYPAASKAAPPCKRKQWSEEPVIATFNELRKETL